VGGYWFRPFLIQMGSENICGQFYPTCVVGRLLFVECSFDRCRGGVGSAGEWRRRRRRLLEASELGLEGLVGGSRWAT